MVLGEVAGRRRLVLRSVCLAVPVRDRYIQCPTAAPLRRQPAVPALPACYSFGLSRLRADCSGALGLVQSASDRNRYSGQDRPGPLRLVNVLATIVLALGSTWFRAVAERPVLRLLVVCGRNSLEVFSLGTVLAMIGQQMFRTYGGTVTMQLLTKRGRGDADDCVGGGAGACAPSDQDPADERCSGTGCRHRSPAGEHIARVTPGMDAMLAGSAG